MTSSAAMRWRLECERLAGLLKQIEGGTETMCPFCRNWAGKPGDRHRDDCEVFTPDGHVKFQRRTFEKEAKGQR